MCFVISYVNSKYVGAQNLHKTDNEKVKLSVLQLCSNTN
jgi:hypothetical protein